jgi:HK97 family phage prohead protease
MTELLERAAHARKAASPAPAARPRERRCSDTPGAFTASRAVTKRPIVVRDSTAGGGLDFHGYASVTEQPYEMFDMFGPYWEIMSAGAFADTLKTPELDVPLVIGHDPIRRLARTTNGTLQLAEDDIGLAADAPNLDPADADVAYIAPKLRSRLIDEMSFRFGITAGMWSPDYTEFRINAADIHRGDVSIVGYGASPYTTATLRSLAGKLQVGRALDVEDVNMLTQAMAWFSAVDNIVDEAQESLAGYLKVPNPDADDVSELAALTLDVLRTHANAVARELRRRGAAPSMSYGDLLAVKV